MKKWRLLPKLAWMGVVKNGTVYFPYMAACIFSVFTIFIFSSIVQNDLISTIPRSQYAWILLQIGKGLLGFILLLFLYYTNSFLIKRRKREIGLYSILGLEKKHIGGMMLLEGIGIYIVTLAAGILCGLVLAKLLFIMLLKMTGLPIDASFTFSGTAFMETAYFFGFVFLLNLIENLIQVSKARPIALLAEGKKGEKETKFLWIYAILGLIAIVWGYRISVTAKVDSMIFLNFLFTILLVILGTYFLFTSGSIALLKILKNKKQTYYSPAHFITISGMLYRMKKNAASLVNICIFSTMVIITLLCTSGLFLGLEDILHYKNPYDIKVRYNEGKPSDAVIEQKLDELSEEYQVQTEDLIFYDEEQMRYLLDGSRLEMQNDTNEYNKNVTVRFVTLADYNKMFSESKTLDRDEIILYCQGNDMNTDTVMLLGQELTVKEELKDMSILPKAGRTAYDQSILLIVADESVRAECRIRYGEAAGVEDMDAFTGNVTRVVQLNLSGDIKAIAGFANQFETWNQIQPGFTTFTNAQPKREDATSMFGGLLFIGILFSIIFSMCLILIMYYKQISEGYEDRDSFAIMQKVGMSEDEIKKTVKKQILLVFQMPILGAFCHTAAGLPFVMALFGTLNMFNDKILVTCAVTVAAIFAVCYGCSYLITAKTYYRIVRQARQNG